MNVSMPSDYPPLEDGVDLRLPLHFSRDLEQGTEICRWLDCEDKIFQEIHTEIREDLTRLGDSLDPEDSWRRLGRITMSRSKLYYFPTRANLGLGTAPRAFVVYLSNGEEHLWPLMDAQIREVFRIRYQNSKRVPPPLRYATKHIDHDVCF